MAWRYPVHLLSRLSPTARRSSALASGTNRPSQATTLQTPANQRQKDETLRTMPDRPLRAARTHLARRARQRNRVSVGSAVLRSQHSMIMHWQADSMLQLSAHMRSQRKIFGARMQLAMAPGGAMHVENVLLPVQRDRCNILWGDTCPKQPASIGTRHGKSLQGWLSQCK